MKIKQGCTRIVFVFDTFVIKIPNFRYGFYNFLSGLISNMNETNTWKNGVKSKVWEDVEFQMFEVKHLSEVLCPVRWGSWGGWILIMERADVEKHIEEVEGGKRFGYSKHITLGYEGDDTCLNYGYYNGNLVKIDYPG